MMLWLLRKHCLQWSSISGGKGGQEDHVCPFQNPEAGGEMTSSKFAPQKICPGFWIVAAVCSNSAQLCSRHWNVTSGMPVQLTMLTALVTAMCKLAVAAFAGLKH